ncbi:hypothetical protein EQG64_02400 [Streptomyces sp. S6]|nr:hypothetical protein EQG64_02400 [Streptomyces sp. S6]
MSKVPPARRCPARTLAALSGSPRYIQYRGDPPPCDRTHRTPPGLPFGQTTLLSTHALDDLRRTRVQRPRSPPGTLPSGRNSTELMYRVRRGTNARRSSP